MWSGDTVEWIDIELTSYCNIDCPGCFRQVKRKKVNNILDKDVLTFKQIKKWINRKTFPNCKLINFCGSIDEPTLHPELLKILTHFDGVNINISSNGSTKTKKFWVNLGERKISVFFGIDGIDQESLEKYRIGSNFKKVQTNWRSFIKAGGKATWQFIAFEHNEHLIDDAKYMAKEEGFENFRLIYSHRDENKESKKIQREEEQKIVCKYGAQKRIFISHTGVLLPCCFLNSEFLQSYATNEHYTDFQHLFKNTGDVLFNSLKYNEPNEIIDGELFSSVIDSWISKPISRCWSTCKQAKQDVFIGEQLQ
jgi:sulfatase maturation enzyme AslB (radical SAM superfamily)